VSEVKDKAKSVIKDAKKEVAKVNKESKKKDQ
jgi:hypothetical protein